MDATPTVLGRYAIFDKIASGGMATVHFGRLAGAAGFSRTVAIKRLHPHLSEEPDFVSMMIDEARLVARVHHPNVVQTLDVVAAEGELLVVMEYVQGESLSRLLRLESQRQRRIPPSIVSAVMTGVLYGLHAAHEAKSERGAPMGIVHRDVSPQNVLVGVDGVARVIDFGVAKAVGRLQTTREGVIKGKLAYMPPEQISGQITTRLGDIYAAGVVLWEMLTGRRLFKADGDAELFGKVLAGPSDPPSRHASDLPQALDALTMRALAREAGARFATARDMADALVRLVPPALSNEVGAWVEDVAHEALSKRADQLAEIESRSSITVPQPTTSASTLAAGDGRVEPAATDGEPATTVSQPARAAVTETRRDGPRRAGLDRRVRVALGSAAAVLVGFGLWRAGAASVPDRPAERAPAVSAPVAATPAPAPSGTPAVVPSSATAPIVTATASSLPRGARAPGSAPVVAPMPRPTAHAPPPKASCNPPYTIDPSGVRLPKPGCY